MSPGYEKMEPAGLALALPEQVALSQVSTIAEEPASHLKASSCVSTPRSDRTADPFDTDIEAMVTHSSIDKGARGSIQLYRKKDCQVWPGEDYWKKRAKAAKKDRSWSCLSRLSKRNRVIAKVVIILLIVGVAVGVGIGISKPLGAPIWNKPHSR